MASRVDSMIQTLISSSLVVVADIETSGLGNYKYRDIIQISAIKVDVTTKKIKEKFNRLCLLKKEKQLSSEIVNLTGITEDQLKTEGVPIEVALNEFYSFVGELPIVAHNAQFDWNRFLEPLLKERGLNSHNQILCSLLMAKKIIPGLPSYKLCDLCSYFGSTMEGAHYALTDCKYTASVVIRLRNKALENAATPSFLQTIIDSPMPAANTACVKTIKLQNPRYWAKGEKKRIYVNSNVGDIFFDAVHHTWTIKDIRTKDNIDWDVVEKEFLKITKQSTMENAVKTLQGRAG